MPDTHPFVRNPFGVHDVPDPQRDDVLEFARSVRPLGGADDANAEAWGDAQSGPELGIDGDWSSRWNGGAAGDQWKQGRAQIRVVDGRFYARFDWDQGSQTALIEAVQQPGAATLAGRYLNLGNPEITRPWVGTIVDARRIDGQWTQGRLDFRR